MLAITRRFFVVAPIVKKTMRQNVPMKKQYDLKPETQGTRTGCAIQFSCPACAAKNVIITRTPQDHFKETHVATCKHCKVRSTILTPSVNHPRSYSPPYPCTG